MNLTHKHIYVNMASLSTLQAAGADVVKRLLTSCFVVFRALSFVTLNQRIPYVAADTIAVNDLWWFALWFRFWCSE